MAFPRQIGRERHDEEPVRRVVVGGKVVNELRDHVRVQQHKTARDQRDRPGSAKKLGAHGMHAKTVVSVFGSGNGMLDHARPQFIRDCSGELIFPLPIGRIGLWRCTGPSGHR